MYNNVNQCVKEKICAIVKVESVWTNIHNEERNNPIAGKINVKELGEVVAS
jgi:hypothetical protein